MTMHVFVLTDGDTFVIDELSVMDDLAEAKKFDSIEEVERFKNHNRRFRDFKAVPLTVTLELDA